MNSDSQKYVLEFELACPEDEVVKKKPKKSTSADTTDTEVTP